MHVTRDSNEFLRLVESGEERIYPEDSSYAAGRAFVPIVIGSVLTIIFLFTLTDLSVTVSPFVHLGLGFAPIILGFLISILLLARISAKDKQYGVRGLTRRQLSQAIYFLDMLLNRRADNGLLFKKPDPEEYRITTTLAFGSTLLVLNKLGKDIAKAWLTSLSEKLQPELSLKTKILLNVTIFGSILIMFSGLAVVFIKMAGWISDEIFLILIAVIVITLLSLVSGLSVYAFKSSKSAAPSGVLAAITEPQVQFETDRALEGVFEMIKTEGQYPLRVLVAGTYDALHYTNRHYMSQRGVELTAAVLFPSCLLDEQK
jgi:hypothetical protein